MRSIFRLASVLAGLCLLSACTGGGGGVQPAIVVQVGPATVTVLLGAQQTFTVTITGTNNRGVSWSVQEGAAGGSIDGQGNYTAPQTAGTFHVVATSMADPSKSSTATVTVPVAVTVSPNPSTVFLGAMQAFTSTVAGSNNSAVTWSVQEGAAGGTIDAQGNYTAPKIAGTYHVIATSAADKTQSGTATVNVPPVAVTVSPDSVTVFLGAMQVFTATVTATNTAVSWSVQEGAAGGTIDAQGNYTAPKIVGTYHVIATSVADKTQSGTATVNVPPVAVTVSPDSVTVFLGAMQLFTATVTATNTAVTWAVQEGAAGGTIDAQGNYTAPKVAGTYHVIATSVADMTKSGTAVVTVPPVAVSILPTADTLGPGGLRAFTSSVTGASDTSVTWSITEGAAGGTVLNGAYTAPKTLGTFHVVATSVADPTKSASATITVVASGFLPTGSMRFARSGHTATLLNTGEALVTGGINHYRFVKAGSFSTCIPVDTSDADLFDPGTGIFASLTPMTTFRAFHTATLLQSGKVLVAGGSNLSPPTAEIYDPATAVFTATGNMLLVRLHHTATLLNSGKVLLAGGLTGGATAELFDPALGGFAATGSMADVRSSHTATPLPNGKVLVVGGSASNGTVATAELYDPTAGTFAATGSMTTPRINHTATFIPSTGMVLMAGGNDQNGAALATAELYNPVTGLFTATGSMAVAHSVATATLLPGGKVLIAGGGNFFAELFDPATGTFTSTGSMFTSRRIYAATALPSGDVLVTGTQTPVRKEINACLGGANASAEVYH